MNKIESNRKIFVLILKTRVEVVGISNKYQTKKPQSLSVSRYDRSQNSLSEI